MQWIYWVIAVAAAAGAGYLVFRADKRRAVPYPLITSVLRSLVVFLALLLILVPTIIITKNVEEKPVVLLLQDDSRSIANALGADSAVYRKNVQDLSARLSEKYKVVKWPFDGAVEGDTLFRYRGAATDISAALARAQEYFGLQNLGAVLLATDGRFNQGTNPMYQQLALHSPLYTIGIGDSTRQKDIRISRTYANRTVSINTSFEIRADILADLCNGFSNNVSVTEAGAGVATAPLSVNNNKYDRSVSFTIRAAKAGLHHYVITVPAAEGEQNTANNRRDVFVEVVEDKKKILVLSAAPHPDVNAIRDALGSMESFKVTVASPDNIPADLAAYTALVVHGLPTMRSRVAAQLQAAHKPTWFILSSQTDVAGLNSIQQLTHTNLIPAPPHDVTAGYESSFNTFLLPQSIRSVTDKMPPLVSNVGNIYAPPGALSLFSQRNGGAPLWMLQQGAVPVAMLFGEGLWRWRLYEYKSFGDHTVIDECIRQTVTFLAANNSERPFTVALPKYVWSDQEPISMSAYLLNANNEQVNTPDVKLTITDSTGRKRDFSFERSGSAYSLNIGIWASGSYSWSAQTTFNDKKYSASGNFVVEGMPLELMETGADYPLLAGLAQKYGGGFVPARNIAALYDSITHNDRIRPVIQTNTETVPLVDRKWYFFLILLLATAEWLLRKYWLAQ